MVVVQANILPYFHGAVDLQVNYAVDLQVNYAVLYNNTCSFCIFIGRELCVIKVHTHGWRQLMA